MKGDTNMKCTLLTFKRCGTFYSSEEFEMPDNIPGYAHQDYVSRKFAHQYADMHKVVVGEGNFVPVMIPRRSL